MQSISLQMERAEAIALRQQMKDNPFPAPVEDFIECLTRAIDGDGQEDAEDLSIARRVIRRLEASANANCLHAASLSRQLTNSNLTINSIRESRDEKERLLVEAERRIAELESVCREASDHLYEKQDMERVRVMAKSVMKTHS